VSLFWMNVFFSGDRQPAAIDLIRASCLLAEIDSRQHAAGQPPWIAPLSLGGVVSVFRGFGMQKQHSPTHQYD
jgi:hypothetical protein